MRDGFKFLLVHPQSVAAAAVGMTTDNDVLYFEYVQGILYGRSSGEVFTGLPVIGYQIGDISHDKKVPGHGLCNEIRYHPGIRASDEKGMRVLSTA